VYRNRRLNMSPRAEHCRRPFNFERDTFAFPHELVWQYRYDAATGQTTTFRTNPPPTYYHRCFVMARSVRQFFFHARFEPDRPAPDAQACRRLVRTVVSRDPRRASSEADRVVIPGYAGLRPFSQAWESLLKAECGRPWESYFLRSHWRMVLPVWRWQQQRTAHRLGRSLQKGAVPVVHLFRFPHITINHGIVLFSSTAADKVIRFHAYDPNIPAHPVDLTYQDADRAFHFPPNHYWAGGKLQVVEIYRNWLY
jgi:hypothetical protein